MKQPALGKKISELRKAKGLTQEELVEKCNISVRTIQRIETGEVTPRSYTIKIILAALDHDLELLADDSHDTDTDTGAFNEFAYPSTDREQPSDSLLKHLQVAWIFGILYFVLGFFEGAADYFRFKDDLLVFQNYGYVLLKVALLISFVFFQRGIFIIGGLFNNYLLKIATAILIGSVVLTIGYDIASLFYNAFERDMVVIGSSLLFGAVGILYGISLTRLESSLGNIAKLAGILELLVAACFLTVVLSFVGLLLQIPAELFGIILIFKAIQVIKETRTEKNFA